MPMQERWRSLRFRSLLSALVLLAISWIPASPWLPEDAPVADFVAPEQAHAAQAIVTAARRHEQIQRNALLRHSAAPVSQSTTWAAMLPPGQNVYFSQTGQHLSDRSGFLGFWRKHGGVLIFGYPISEELDEDGRVTQYFERARFEFHPEQENPEYRVQLSLFGKELTTGRDFPRPAPGSGEQYFPETGHSMSGAFYDFWRKRGGVQVFGYPISEPFTEASPVDGKPYTVQYFERARFDHHAEDMPPFYRDWAQSRNLRLRTLYEVQLADLGRQAGAARGHNFARSTQQPEAPEWSPLLWTRRIDINLSTQFLTAYEDDMPVFHAPVATGKNGFNTPTGSYAIYAKYPKRTMIGAAGSESWNVPNIPWVQYIVGGVALHGTYWHDRWGTGTRISHGCINLNIDDAQWLYIWADVGTQVNIVR